MAEAAAVYMLSVAHRYYFSLDHSVPAKITPIPNTSLVEISLPVPQDFTFLPGQHLYVKLPNSSPIPFFPLNPFSIASIPITSQSDKQIVSLVVRRFSGPSSRLAEAVSSPIPLTYSLPYGSSANFPNLLSFDRVLLFAGGIGATFTLPIYMNLLCQADSVANEPKLGDGQTTALGGNPKPNISHRTQRAQIESERSTIMSTAPQNIHHIWTVRSFADTAWALPLLSSTLPSHLQPNSYSFQAPTFMVHVTSSSSPDPPKQQEESLSRLQLQIVPDAGRPDFERIVNRVFGEKSVESVAVLVCGPPQMEENIRQTVGGWVMGRKKKEVTVFWHAEGFGW